ncbi:response regulator [Segetibacter sp. 3557_3]|uniref:response regulator n=1 Tax=Segetibacter sp. 3557_3 TaxID=2547429 RepID=UPI001058A9F1|nr:response regulator [Segetibacter sp. 3557_3]TDH29206.1 response regulator [Segetibacter sp. 3557_3]
MTNQKSFLIIDDDVDDQEIFAAAVEELDDDIRCITAFDCDEALDFLKKNMDELPDYIFLDLNMPRVNGRQCLVELKKLPGVRDVPIVIYSTSSLKKDMEETLEMGASHFLVKPSKFDELCGALKQLLASDYTMSKLEN